MSTCNFRSLSSKFGSTTIRASIGVWLGGAPVGQVKKLKGQQATLTYLHTDHLLTPLVATDAQQKIVWRCYSDAFGETPADSDPDKDGRRTEVQQRFPGQFADEESGLYYNVFRYYDLQSGRYTQSGPIGLNGGWNSFAYAEGAPMTRHDRLGLAVYLSFHEVEVGGGGGVGTGSNHLAVLIIPDDQAWAASEAARAGRFLLGGSGAGIAANRYYTTISAGPNPGLPFPGNLVSTPNREGDEPWNNFTAPRVSSPTRSSTTQCYQLTDREFVSELLRAETNFLPTFNYDFFPEQDTDGYNSNSFAMGILQAVGANLTDSSGQFPGADKPIPAWGFGVIRPTLNLPGLGI